MRDVIAMRPEKNYESKPEHSHSQFAVAESFTFNSTSLNYFGRQTKSASSRMHAQPASSWPSKRGLPDLPLWTQLAGHSEYLNQGFQDFVIAPRRAWSVDSGRPIETVCRGSTAKKNGGSDTG